MFRIRDILHGRTLIESNRGRDIVAYQMENYRRGYDEWAIQYFNEKSGTWDDVPARVKKEWVKKWEERER